MVTKKTKNGMGVNNYAIKISKAKGITRGGFVRTAGNRVITMETKKDAQELRNIIIRQRFKKKGADLVKKLFKVVKA